MKKKLVSTALILSLVFALFSALAAPAAAQSSAEHRERTVEQAKVGESLEYSLLGVSSKSQYAYPALAVYIGGSSLGGVAKLINGEVYLPVRRVANALTPAAVSFNSASRTLTVTGRGYNISVSDGAYALYADGRVFFSRTPSVILSDGRMYTPASVLLRAFSLSYTASSDAIHIVGTPTPARSGVSYYDADAVYWLSRIISAESRGEPLIGQIAVGNVVLNRVRSQLFPNTIWGVIFDRKYGVQFSPVSNGTIYAAPTATAVLAAKICLDGFTVSPDALYFLRPDASASSWIVQNREYLFTISHHYFFA